MPANTLRDKLARARTLAPRPGRVRLMTDYRLSVWPPRVNETLTRTGSRSLSEVDTTGAFVQLEPNQVKANSWRNLVALQKISCRGRAQREACVRGSAAHFKNVRGTGTTKLFGL